jgi:polyhydroxybutyrate depolymerase
VAENTCIDLDKVFVTGWSNGAYMAYYLACRADDVFAAVAPVAGLIGVEPEYDCSPKKPPRVLAFHGKRDSQVDYFIIERDEYMGAEELLAEFASKQGCSEVVEIYRTPREKWIVARTRTARLARTLHFAP